MRVFKGKLETTADVIVTEAGPSPPKIELSATPKPAGTASAARAGCDRRGDGGAFGIKSMASSRGGYAPHSPASAEPRRPCRAPLPDASAIAVSCAGMGRRGARAVGASGRRADGLPAEVSDRREDRGARPFREGRRAGAESAWAAALAEFLLSRDLYPTRSATNNAATVLRRLQRLR